MTILLVSTCKENFHELEFLKPVEKILNENNTKFFTRHYSNISKKDLQKAGKIIICGTSLKDNGFMRHKNKLGWIKSCEKPILGICAGMQIISVIFGAKLKKRAEIGFYMEDFSKGFLSLKGEHEVYHLHTNSASLPKNFDEYTHNIMPQAIKHKEKEIYGVLFHPEVRNKKLIEEFAK